MPNFETFTKGAAPPEKRAYVTLQRKGPISLNLAAFRALGQPAAIELLFDPDEQIIGLKASSKKNRNAYPIRSVGAATHVLAGRAFMKFYEIDMETTRRYPAEIYENGILGIDLKVPGVAKTSNRNKERANGNGHRDDSRSISLGS